MRQSISVILFFTLAIIAITAFSAANVEITYSKTRKAWLQRSAFAGVIAGTLNFILFLISVIFSSAEFLGALLFSLIFALIPYIVIVLLFAVFGGWLALWWLAHTNRKK